MSILDNLRQERATLLDDTEALMTGDFDPKDSTLVEARGKIEALDGKIAALVEHQGRRAAANEIDAISVRTRQVAEQRETREAVPLDLGEAWTRSKAYENYRQTPKGNSMTVDVPFASLQQRAPILTTTFPGLIQPDRIDPSAAPAQQTPLLDLIRTIRVSSNAVEWVFYPAASPVAAVVPEGTAKPEAAVTPILKTITLDTLAHFVTYSRQFGEDAQALVDFLNATLRRGIQDAREAAAAAVLVADASIPVTTNTGTLLQGIRRAIGDVQNAGYNPQAVALHPSDYAELDLDVLGMTLRGPVVNGSFWGIRPVPVAAIPSGTAFVGDFTTGMAELVRSEVQVYTTDSHASQFVSNLLTTLVEARTKPIVHRPEALSKVSGTVLPPLGDAPATSKGK